MTARGRRIDKDRTTFMIRPRPGKISLIQRCAMSCAPVLTALFTLTAHAQPAADVQAAASFARFAGAFCGATPKGIEDYKEALRKTQPSSPGFESAWNLGWANALDHIIEYRDLRLTAPKDFAGRIRDDCSLVRWEAPNAAQLCMTKPASSVHGSCR